MSNKVIKTEQKKEKNEETITESIMEYILAAVGIALCILVPLYLKDGYYNVGTVKFTVYRWIILLGFGALVLLTVLWIFTQNPQKEKRLTDTDWCVLIFLLLTVIAALAGGNFQDCLSGYSGWNMGLWSMFSFGLIYYYFSRFGRYSKLVLTCLCISALIAFSIGILHRLLIDPIGTYTDIADTYKNQFLSTLGQATWYSSFVCTVLPLGLGVFWCSRTTRVRILSGIFSFAGFCTMVTQNSDSAYVALVGMLAVFFWFSISSARRMERLMQILLLFVAATRFMYVALLIHPNSILSLDTLSNFLVFHQAMWIALVVAAGLWLAAYMIAKSDWYPAKAVKILRNVIFICMGIAVVAAGWILIMSAKGSLPEGIAKVTQHIPYLTWSDSWGNGRGRTWAFSLQMFRDMPVLNQFFGVGPDGYAPYAYSLYSSKLAEMWGDRTLTNAHNEWMNALINYGIMGATAYIGIFVTSVKNFAKEQSEKPEMVGFIACVISYMCHNFFCYQQVCCTPFLFLLIGAGIYLMKQKA